MWKATIKDEVNKKKSYSIVGDRKADVLRMAKNSKIERIAKVKGPYIFRN